MPANEQRASWAPAALQDVDDIFDYYALNASFELAESRVQQIEAIASRVARHPFRGRSRDALRPGLRSVRVPPHLVFYRVVTDGIEVVRVLHERRDLAAAFNEDVE